MSGQPVRMHASACHGVQSADQNRMRIPACPDGRARIAGPERPSSVTCRSGQVVPQWVHSQAMTRGSPGPSRSSASGIGTSACRSSGQAIARRSSSAACARISTRSRRRSDRILAPSMEMPRSPGGGSSNLCSQSSCSRSSPRNGSTPGPRAAARKPARTAAGPVMVSVWCSQSGVGSARTISPARSAGAVSASARNSRCRLARAS